MSSQIRYLLDTTILEDYFFAVNPNSKNWLRNVIANNDGEIILTPVILIELIRRLYYIRQKDAKKVRYSIKILTNAIKQITYTNMSKNEAKDISRKIEHLPVDVPCHVGELSLLPYIQEQNTVVVSSDQNVLKAYVQTTRIDPRTSPPTTLNAGVNLEV